MTNNKLVKFYPIVGFEHYFLTDDFKVFSKKTNCFLTCRKNFSGKNDYYEFALGKRGKHIQISLPRIVYSVEKGINPRSISNNIIIRFKNNVPGIDNIIVLDRSMFAEEIRLITSKNPANESFYERCHEFTGLILKNETDAIYKFIDKYNHLIIGTLCKYINYPLALKVYSDLVNDLIIGIIDRRYQCFDPVTYLQKCINRKFRNKKTK